MPRGGEVDGCGRGLGGDSERVPLMHAEDYHQRSTWTAASNRGGRAGGGALFFCKSKLLHYAILSCSSSLKQYCNNQHKNSLGKSLMLS